MSLKLLLKRAKEIYPSSRRMQRSWVRQTFQLLSSGHHALQTGGWRRANH